MCVGLTSSKHEQHPAYGMAAASVGETASKWRSHLPCHEQRPAHRRRVKVSVWVVVVVLAGMAGSLPSVIAGVVDSPVVRPRCTSGC